VLPLLDWSSIERHPKIVIGYSNITALLVAIATRARLVTFHGPTILDGFSEFPEMLPYTREQLQKVICTAQPAGVLHPPAEWTSDYPHDDRPRQMEPNPGWRWLQPGQAQGRLVGGHLTTLRTLAGTPFWPSLRDAILFLEDLTLLSPTMAVQHVVESLAHLQMLGVFDEIAGLVVGKVAGLSIEDDRLLEDLMGRYVKPYRFPVLTHVDLGHTDPKLTLPIGVQATLDSEQDRFSIDEPAVI
jgi:muramoyltetrapeptide carboxypeptidase LdcA involved in peptidoglycan recycling